MHKIEPYISTLDEATAQISQFGRPRFYYFYDGISSLVLQGGSIKHWTTISLIKSIHGGRQFGEYRHWTCYRLVIRDDKYRTKYSVEGEWEYNKLKNTLVDFARVKNLTLRFYGHYYKPEYVYERLEEVGLNTYPKIKVMGDYTSTKCDDCGIVEPTTYVMIGDKNICGDCYKKHGPKDMPHDSSRGESEPSEGQAMGSQKAEEGEL